MKIGMILINNSGFPPDIRVEKEARALTSAGFEISILTNSPNGHLEVDKSTFPGITIMRYPVKKRPIIIRLPSFFTLKSPEWYKPLEYFFSLEEPDILHVHDFTYLPTVFHVNSKINFNRKIVADLHENMPAAQVAYRKGKNVVEKTSRIILHSYSRWRRFEKEYLKKCVQVITVVPEAQDRLRSYGIAKERLTIVSNTEDETTFTVDKGDKNIEEKYKDRFLISYIGGIGPHRGLDTVIRAMPNIIEEIPDVLFLIVGAKGKEVKPLQKLVRKKKIEPWVSIEGWKPFEQVNHYVRISDICLVPHSDLEHTNTTVPHKLFQYMISQKPLLVSSCRPLKRIIGDNSAGFVFEADNVVSCAKSVIDIYNNKSLAEERAHTARELALNEYSWKKDKQTLIDMYKTLS